MGNTCVIHTICNSYRKRITGVQRKLAYGQINYPGSPYYIQVPSKETLHQLMRACMLGQLCISLHSVLLSESKVVLDFIAFRTTVLWNGYIFRILIVNIHYKTIPNVSWNSIEPKYLMLLQLWHLIQPCLT